MSLKLNLRGVEGRDNEDLPLSSVNETGTQGERANGGCKVDNGIGIQGNAANAERRVLTDRLNQLLSVIFVLYLLSRCITVVFEILFFLV